MHLKGKNSIGKKYYVLYFVLTLLVKTLRLSPYFGPIMPRSFIAVTDFHLIGAERSKQIATGYHHCELGVVTDRSATLEYCYNCYCHYCYSWKPFCFFYCSKTVLYCFVFKKACVHQKICRYTLLLYTVFSPHFNVNFFTILNAAYCLFVLWYLWLS